jgi:hypothetical protein
MPSRAITPAMPVTSPANRLRSTASDRIKHSASTAVNSGSAAVRIPAAEELTCSSPQAVRNVGQRHVEQGHHDDRQDAAAQPRGTPAS